MSILGRSLAVVATMTTLTAGLLTAATPASASEVDMVSLFTSHSHCPSGYHEIIVGAKYTGDLVYVCYN